MAATPPREPRTSEPRTSVPVTLPPERPREGGAPGSPWTVGRRPAASPWAGPPRRERAFNAPGPVLAVAAVLAAVHVWQVSAPAQALAYALVPAELSAGRWSGLVGHILLHGGVLHLALNGAALLAFGAPVARLFGRGARGALLFLALFLACGVLGGLAFWALQPGAEVPLVGASGAISGLMGAAARLVERPGRVGPLFSRTALGFIGVWVALNLALALLDQTPALGLPIAWEAHLGGLAAGLVLIGPFAALRGGGRRH